MTLITDLFSDAARLAETAMDRLLPATNRDGPQRLYEAMRWSTFAGGKRLRPALVLAAGRSFGAADERLASSAAAVELLHTYSLIHDDLPSMDNDDLRRGVPTCHKRFGEAAAILAGDALQALAFRALAEDEGLAPDVRLRLVSGLAQAAAMMVAGQQLDLEAEGRNVKIEELEAIHLNKTGALIRFSAEAGAVVACANENELAAVSEYGAHLGLLFQIRDDVLDITQTTAELGKTAGKDAASAKATYPALFGIEKAEELASQVYRRSAAALESLNRPAPALVALAEFILHRTS
jgi:geranylgeranyl pyrophosphate synthase